MIVPDNGLLPIREIRENLFSLPYTDTDKARDVRHITCLHLASFGAVTIWVPTSSPSTAAIISLA